MTKLKAFTLYFSKEENGFVTKEFDDFVSDKKVINVWEHFFNYENQVYWAILITYEEMKEEKKVEWNEIQKKLWDMLRAWRIARAKQDGHPAYLVLHDKQLIEIVTKIPTSDLALKKIHGIGESKALQYGPEILKVIEQWQKENRFQEISLQQK